MKQEVRSLLKKARRSLGAARVLLADGHADFAASRAYYAAFYAAEAFLLARGLSYSRHSTVIAEFGRHAVKNEGLPASLHRVLIDAFDDRNVADYGGGDEITPTRSQRLLERVSDFLDAVERHLEGAEREQ